MDKTRDTNGCLEEQKKKVEKDLEINSNVCYCTVDLRTVLEELENKGIS